MLPPREWLGGSAYGLQFAFELASFIMLSPREWLGGSAPGPRFAFELASYTSCRRVELFGAVPLNPGSRLSGPASHTIAAWMVWGSAPRPQFAFELASYTSYRRMDGLRQCS